MNEFGLAEASMRSGEVTVSFRKVALHSIDGETEPVESASDPVSQPETEVPKGMPITSPMNGIFYSTPGPGSPPFVKEGDSITVGQVVGLIEAMKVFNEITASVNGVVTQLVAESGQVVQPGDTLMLVS